MIRALLRLWIFLIFLNVVKMTIMVTVMGLVVTIVTKIVNSEAGPAAQICGNRKRQLHTEHLDAKFVKPTLSLGCVERVLLVV